MTHTSAIFDRHAAGYDVERRRLIPPFDAFYGAAVGALALAGRPLRRVLDLGATAEQWAGARERMGADRLASLEDHLRWLRGAGFADVDCLFKDHCFAVLVARR